MLPIVSNLADLCGAIEAIIIVVTSTTTTVVFCFRVIKSEIRNVKINLERDFIGAHPVEANETLRKDGTYDHSKISD